MQIVVTGTDTEVGKTYVSAVIVKQMNATYWKPIQSGTPTDTDWIRSHTDQPCLPEAYRLTQPLSPHLAAAIDGVEIIPPEVPDVSPLVIEGAGGVHVPVNDTMLYSDLFAAWELPVLVVARSTLGTINHTLLTLEALRAKQIPILGVVLNGPSNPHNKEAIARYGDVAVTDTFEEIPCLIQSGAPFISSSEPLPCQRS